MGSGLPGATHRLCDCPRKVGAGLSALTRARGFPADSSSASNGAFSPSRENEIRNRVFGSRLRRTEPRVWQPRANHIGRPLPRQDGTKHTILPTGQTAVPPRLPMCRGCFLPASPGSRVQLPSCPIWSQCAGNSHGRLIQAESSVGGKFGSSAAQAMPLAPIHQPESATTQMAYGCGVGRTRVGGMCVARTTIRQTRPLMTAGIFTPLAADGF